MGLICIMHGMKMTFNIDEDLLERVMDITESATKTDAIHYALREVDRRARLIEVLKEGSGMTPDELKDCFDPASDPMRFRVVAEEDVSWGDLKSEKESK